MVSRAPKEISELERAALAGYCLGRSSQTILKRSGRDLLQITVWDRDRDRLWWAARLLTAALPLSRSAKASRVSWQDSRGQGAIHVTGLRAEALLRLIARYTPGLMSSPKAPTPRSTPVSSSSRSSEA